MKFWQTTFLTSVQSLSCVRLFVTSWTAAHQASLSITNSQSLLKLMWCHATVSSSVVPSSSCLQPFPLSGSFPMSQFFMRWTKYWSFSFSISPCNEHSGLISFRMDWLDPFPIWNQSVVPCPVLTVASWPVYRFLKRHVTWSGIPISLRIFHSLLWSTQSKALA